MRRLLSVSIFSILNHLCFFMVYYYLFGVFPSLWTSIFRFPLIQGNSVVGQNNSKYPDRAPSVWNDAFFSEFNWFSFFSLIHSIEETSTASQLVEYVLDWMNTHHENSRFTQVREFLHSKMIGWFKMAAISISFLAVLIVIIVCTVKWFGIKVTKQEPIHCETGNYFLIACRF